MSAMQAWWAVTGIVAVAFVTPGPNNFAVLAAASRIGFIGAAAPAAGVIAGTIALVLVSWAGVGALFDMSPAMHSGLPVAGGFYFAWLGVQLFRAHEGIEQGSALAPASVSFIAMFGLQFVNPKAWVLVLTVTAVAPGGVSNLPVLVLTMATASLVCLSLWAGIGNVIGVWLHRREARRWLDRVLGASLIGLAALTLAQL